jgi:hypothetical protein
VIGSLGDVIEGDPLLGLGNNRTNCNAEILEMQTENMELELELDKYQVVSSGPQSSIPEDNVEKTMCLSQTDN